MTIDQWILIIVAGVAALATLGAATIQAIAAIIAAWIGRDR